MHGVSVDPLTGLLILIVGIAFIIISSVLFLIGMTVGMFISAIVSFILIVTGSIIYFSGETSIS
ncbi:MAG TPA: hypothetical protein VMC42_10125 [Methanoregulaceae archaeon]|nr:hypothetical protein [Methanoregulaceae archaeon]